MGWIYYITWIILKSFFFLFTKLKIVGLENLPRKGSLLIIANHPSFIDPPLLGVSLGRQVYFMAKRELFRPWLAGVLMRAIKSFPVNRGSVNRLAMQEIERLFTQGEALVIFPEGRRNFGRGMHQAYPGAAMVATKFSVPIAPVAVVGTERLKGKAWFLRRPNISVAVGPVFNPVYTDGQVNRDEINEMTTEMMNHLVELLPDEHHGYYVKSGEGGECER